MSLPRATMRLQFHRGFTFEAAVKLVPYLAKLGVSHLYSSPILTARPGSQHGYDVIDASRINAELGGEDGLRRLVEELRRHELGLIVDIVPNHMAIGSSNAWWMDVLAHGRRSRFAKYFDIDWAPPSAQLRGKVLLPVLGRPYGEALDAGEIALARDDQRRACVRYFDHTFPLADETVPQDAQSLAEFDPASASGRQRLHAILEAQHYRLAWWRSANDDINWRRFFDINELVALRVEDDDVFEAVHASIFRLYAEGLIDGVRVDHIDGLAQPENYCRKLRQRLQSLEGTRPRGVPGGPAYFVVEKILAREESLPPSWATDGTTGYDFMDEISALQHDDAGEPRLRDLWRGVSGRPADFADEETLARRQILLRSFCAQREACIESLYALAQSDLATRDYSRAAIHRCLTEILVHFPVYRIYSRVGCANPSDAGFLSRAVEGARRTGLAGDDHVLGVVEEWLSGKRSRPDAAELQAVAMTRFQQLSAPLCAKAVEDTAFYRYGRLISRNDVGFDARQFALLPAEFHSRMQARAEHFPHSMLTTATHDHKRGEDARARLAVLSEISGQWADAVERWLALAASDFDRNDRGGKPSAGDRAILFQTLVGAWPLGLTPTDRDGLSRYAKRIAAWQQKALREAKLHSDWSAPNAPYERAAADFINWIFSGSSGLLAELAAFAARIAPAGAANGLAQVLVRLTAPGVPDTYQGTEYWDLSLVDPDNRVSVDFAARVHSLDAALPCDLAPDWADGRIKQALIGRTLALRKRAPRLFTDGAYQPLDSIGPKAAHVLAFARLLDGQIAITIACRRPFHLLAPGLLATVADNWNGTRIVLPAKWAGAGTVDALSGQTFSSERELDVERVLARLPVALLTNVGH